MNVLLPLLRSLIPHAAAQDPVHRTLDVSAFFGTLNVNNVMANFANTLIGSAFLVCIAIFVAGAFFYTISTGDDQRKSLGKGMMMGAAIGVAVIAGAQAIMNTVLFFVYG